MNRKIEKPNSYEPLFYMAFVLKGTEQQYVDLLKYVKEQSGAQLIYQGRSLTYLYISREDPQKHKMTISHAPTETIAEDCGR